MISKAISGGWYPKLSLKPIELSRHLARREALLLLAAGVLAVALHTLFHWPMKLPGRHGLEWMALLIFARTTGRYQWAATVAALGAAVTVQLPIAGHYPPSEALSYLIPGIVVDVCYQSNKGWRQHVLFLAGIAAFAHATRPLLHYLEVTYLAMDHGSLAGGLSYPVLTHLGFGFVGGGAGAILAGLTRRQRS